MNLWGKAVVSGVAIEGMLFSVMHTIGWGSCGPNSPVGFVLMLLHFPGIMLSMPLAWLKMPSWADAPVLFVMSCVFWVLITYAFLVTRQRR